MARFHLAWALVLSLSPLTAAAADWPQWQGAQRNGVSQESGLLQQWPSEGPPLLRKITGLGGGDSAPAIAGGRIFGMGGRRGEEVVWALSESDGAEIWSTSIGEVYEQRMPQSQEGPGCTPTIDGDRLYVLGMDGTLACLTTAEGEIVWRRSLTKDFGGRVPMWSYRESPLIDGDKVIATPGAQNALMVALDKNTGETLWECKTPDAVADSGSSREEERPRGGFGGGVGGRPDHGGRPGFGGFGGRGGGSGAAYASAIAVDLGGKRQYVQLTSKALMGISAEDGEVLWQYKNAANSNGVTCTTPVLHDDKIFATSAYGAGGGLVKLNEAAEGKLEAEEVWFSRRMQNHHGGIVVADGAIYGANGGNGGGALICLDFQTGEELWDERGSGRAGKGSIAMADGRIYYRTEEGEVLLIEPSRDEFLERGRFKQPERTRSPAWSHPVIANGRLYIRDQDKLFTYDVQAK